jgi:tetrahydromethanopterin S-methyltransferase subunit G
VKIHKRTLVVEQARNEFMKFMLDLEEKHDLTFGEMYSILGRKIADLAMYQIRSERHPDDPDKKGDDA